MEKYSNLMEKTLQKNKDSINTLIAFQSIIAETNNLVAEYEKEDGIEYVSLCYPCYGNDYLLITIYLSEKGRIIRDVGTFLEAFVQKTGCEYDGDVQVDADHQHKTWTLVHRGLCYTYLGRVENPRIRIVADAKKATVCKRVPTGEMIPVYEFVCVEVQE